MTSQMSRAAAAHRREVVTAAGLVLFVVLVAACTAGPNAAAGQGPNVAGFWLGLWHGLIAPITFLVSLFNHSVGIYEVHNNGGWYNVGFLSGVSIFLSGSGVGAGGRSRSSRRSANGTRDRNIVIGRPIEDRPPD